MEKGREWIQTEREMGRSVMPASAVFGCMRVNDSDKAIGGFSFGFADSKRIIIKRLTTDFSVTDFVFILCFSAFRL